MFKINGDFITLGQLLKALNYASTGGEVKYVLSKFNILINHEKEVRRGKKIYKTDNVVVNGKRIDFEQ